MGLILREWSVPTWGPNGVKISSKGCVVIWTEKLSRVPVVTWFMAREGWCAHQMLHWSPWYHTMHFSFSKSPSFIIVLSHFEWYMLVALFGFTFKFWCGFVILWKWSFYSDLCWYLISSAGIKIICVDSRDLGKHPYFKGGWHVTYYWQMLFWLTSFYCDHCLTSSFLPLACKLLEDMFTLYLTLNLLSVY